MSTIELEVFSGVAPLPSSPVGPVSAARHRRNVLVYALLCVLGLLPTLFDAAPGWQVAGLGLLLPGGGFTALGGAWLLALPLTLGLFWLSIIVWFWCGMVLAPIAVWLGAAWIAGAAASTEPGLGGYLLTPLVVAGFIVYARRRNAQRAQADLARHAARSGFFAASLAEVKTHADVVPAPDTRELSTEQLLSVRHLLNLALQPVGEYAGYTIIDQFQPAALRYQINHLGYGLGLVRTHYTPNFRGYLDQAQRNAIETYLNRRVWDYWVLESIWGHFNFTNFDPAAKDNIMLTGYYGMQVNQYMLSSGDRRYAEPGSLTFRLDERQTWPHDAHSLVRSVCDNHRRSDYCLFPCEPNWIYPVCNMYGMGALASHDRVFGTRYVEDVLPRWMAMLDSEFTDRKGSLIGLRSYWTGIEIPFYAGEAGFAFFANVFSPALGQRLWAIGRKELSFCLAPDAQGATRLSIPREALSFLDTIDPGHYRPGALFAYAAVALCAREFGDEELAEASLRSMDQDCGRVIENGALRYADASGLANLWAIEARLARTGDFRRSFVDGPSVASLSGPILDEAPYPAVLVAQALSDGTDLRLVLHPGAGDDAQTLGFARLQPGRAYQVTGDVSERLLADGEGRARLTLRLHGRTTLRIVPAAD